MSVFPIVSLLCDHDRRVTQRAVAEDKSFIDFGKIAEFDKTQQNTATYLDGFKPPIYNIWKQQEKTSGSSHFGNSEIQWLDLFEQVPLCPLFN